jgi:hypothetical protein
VARTPNGELHGAALAAYWREKDKFDAAMAALVASKRMP